MAPFSDPESRSDEELIEAINGGNEMAFEEIYYRYRDWVVRLAHRQTGSADDALDVLQETFAYLAGKFPGFRLSARLTTFLYPVVKNHSIAARRKRQRFAGDEQALRQEAAPAPTTANPGNEDLAIVVSGLAEGAREVILMRFVDGMSLQEIAQALRIPLGTVKSRLHNALDALRNDPRTAEYFRPR